MNFDLEHITGSGHKKFHVNIIEIQIGALMQHYESVGVRYACEIGCKNFNHKWCCPPESKTFDMIMGSYSRAIITCLYMYLKEFDCISNKYQIIRAANSILKSQSNKLSRNIEIILDGLALLNGSCNLCKPCAKKLDLPCKKPSQMRFSMESVGINVCKLLQSTMDFQLQWYSKGYTPEYTSVASCILFDSNSPCDIERLLRN